MSNFDLLVVLWVVMEVRTRGGKRCGAYIDERCDVSDGRNARDGSGPVWTDVASRCHPAIFNYVTDCDKTGGNLAVSG